MKILVVNHDNELSGASMSMLDWTEGINDEIEFFLPYRGTNGLYKKLLNNHRKVRKIRYYQCVLKNGKINFLKNVYRYLHYIFQNVFLIKKYARYCKKNGFDVVYSNTISTDFGARIAKKCKIKHCWHVREFLEEDHNMRFISKKVIEKLAINSKFIFISNCTYEYWKDILPIKDHIIQYNRVKYNDSYIHNNSGSNEVNCIIVGQIKESKGHMQVLKAFELLKINGYDNIKLYICGKGNGETRFKKYVENHNLNNVFFLGYRNDVENVRKNMDISLVCSYCEAFGRVTVESMYYENIVIASNRGANLELIKNGINGFLYDIADERNLYEKIIYVSNMNQKEKKTIIMNAKTEAIQKYSKQIFENIMKFMEN